MSSFSRGNFTSTAILAITGLLTAGSLLVSGLARFQSGVRIDSNVPSSTASVLYNNSGTLTWGGAVDVTNITTNGTTTKKTVVLSAAGCNSPAQAPATTSTLSYIGNNVYRLAYFQPLTYTRCQVQWVPPDSWDGGTIAASFIYSVTTTDANGVTWGLQAQGLAAGVALSTEFSAATGTVTTVATSTNIVTMTSSTNVAIGGSINDPPLVNLQASRSNVGTSTNTSELVAIKIEYGVNSSSD